MLNPVYLYSVLISWYSQIWPYCSYLCTYQHIMPKVNQILEKFKVYCMNMLLSLPQHLKVNYFRNLLSEKWQKIHGGRTSPQCKASRFLSWNWKWAKHFENMLYQILQIIYFLCHFNRANLSVCFPILYINMLCIQHFNWKCRKLIGQNIVKLCKL